MAASKLPTKMTPVHHTMMALGPRQSRTRPPMMGKTVLTNALALVMTPYCALVMSRLVLSVFFSGERAASVQFEPRGNALHAW